MRYRNLGVYGFLLLAFLLFPATVLATSVHGAVINRHRSSQQRSIPGAFSNLTQLDRLSSGDLADHRIAPGGTPGWNLLNLRLGYPFPWFRLNGGIQNLLNEAYRIHGSGLDGYGRSGWLAVRLRF